MVLGIVQPVFDQLLSFYTMVGDWVYAFYVQYSRLILDVLHGGFDAAFQILIALCILIGIFYIGMALSIVFRKAKPVKKELPLGKNMPFVTIQIPTFNEIAALSCAKRCLAFDYPSDRYEIIIGDDSNDPQVSAAINDFAKKHGRVRITRRGHNHGYKPGNLNYMLKYTKGEFIIIFDSDFLPQRDFLRRILIPFSDPAVSVVQARWSFSNFSQNLYSILGGNIMLITHYIVLPFISKHGGNACLCGSAEAVRRSDLQKLGGWKEGSLTEDVEYSLRLMQEGKKLIYLEDLECSGEAPYTFSDIIRQQMRWAYGVIRALADHSRTLWTSNRVKAGDKLNVIIFASGYLFAVILVGIAIFGFLSFISDRPAPIIWSEVFSETLKYLFLTSGFLVTSVIALSLGKKLGQLPRMVVSSLSVGFIVTYFVNLGIAKAIFGRQMQWYMLSKNGNQRVVE